MAAKEIPKCNACKTGSLSMTETVHEAFGKMVSFQCDSCDQHISVYSDGRMGQTVVPILWPSDPKTNEMRHRIADDFEVQQKFFTDLRELAGYLGAEEKAARYQVIEDNAAEFKREHPLTFWEKLERWLKGIK